MNAACPRIPMGGGCLERSPLPLSRSGKKLPKPPAFQFYAKDWRSSPTVCRMSRAERGLYVDLLALAWDSDHPGTIDLPLAEIAKTFGIKSEILRKFFGKFPETFQKIGGKFAQKKLQQQYAKSLEISEKRRQAASKSSANAKQLGGSAFASAFSSASAITPKPSAESQGFLLFIENYPQDHLGIKGEALRSWAEIPSAEMHMGEILEGLERWKSSAKWKEEDGRWIPNAVNFIRAKKWRIKPPQSLEEHNAEVIARTAEKYAQRVGGNPR